MADAEVRMRAAAAVEVRTHTSARTRMLPILRDDALISTDDGTALRICLPWIRSLPLASLTDLAVCIDGDPVDVVVALPGRRIPPLDLTSEDDWWFVQDRLVVEARDAPARLRPGVHDVCVSFRLVIPYLEAGPHAPLTLPFRADAVLTLDSPRIRRIAPTSENSGAGLRRCEDNPNFEAPGPVSLGSPRAPTPGSTTPDAVPAGWTLAASSFNWTPDVIAASRSAADIAVGIVEEGVADVIEVEPGQLWRSFPDPADSDADALRAALDAAGGSVSIVGASIDDWASPTRRRSEAERLAFLMPQLRAAHRLGAQGVRLPIGQAGESLLRLLQPVLEELDLVLYEEAQGHQTPQSEAHARAYETIARLDDPRIRLLVDISMLMPALPVSYLALLRDGGVPASLVDELDADWRSPDVDGDVLAVLRSGDVPPAVRTAYMNLLVRFGRADAADLRDILPLVGAFHVKFWDLDDADGRVTWPIRELGALLGAGAWRGTLTSEWGGHEWLDDDATVMTRSHLAIARAALAEGAASV
jgi:hypothetical protein